MVNLMAKMEKSQGLMIKYLIWKLMENKVIKVKMEKMENKPLIIGLIVIVIAMHGNKIKNKKKTK